MRSDPDVSRLSRHLLASTLLLAVACGRPSALVDASSPDAPRMAGDVSGSAGGGAAGAADGGNAGMAGLVDAGAGPDAPADAATLSDAGDGSADQGRTRARFGNCSSGGWCWASPHAVLQAANLQAVWGSGPNDVWAVGAGGVILHWNGTAWTSSPS